MAFDILEYQLQVNFMDNSGQTVPRTYVVPEGVVADLGEFEAIVPAMLTIVTNVTDALISSYRITQVTINDTIVLPASGVENENQAFFSGKIVGDPTKSATLSIPAAKPGIFVATSGPGANVIDLADAAVIALIGAFDGAPGWTLSDGEAWVNASVSGKRRHSKNLGG